MDKVWLLMRYESFDNAGPQRVAASEDSLKEHAARDDGSAVRWWEEDGCILGVGKRYQYSLHEVEVLYD